MPPEPIVREILRGRLLVVDNLCNEKALKKMQKIFNKGTLNERGKRYHTYTLDTVLIPEITERLRTLQHKTVNKILDQFEGCKIDLLLTCYPQFLSKNDDGYHMEPHYDGWSDWNILLSVGSDSKLVTNRATIPLHSGSVVLFDGNHIYHGVDLVDTSHCLKIRGSKYCRATVQYRRKIQRQLPFYYRKKLTLGHKS